MNKRIRKKEYGGKNQDMMAGKNQKGAECGKTLEREYGKSNPFLVPASFTLEITYVMAVFLLGLVTVVGFVYRLHGRVIAEYVTHYSSVRASHIEKIYENDGLNLERVNYAANDHIQKIGILRGSTVESKRELFHSTSVSGIFGENFSVKKSIYNPENFMRMITVVEGIQENIEKDEAEEKKENGKKKGE